MITFYKKLGFLSCLVMFFVISAKETKKIQLILNPSDPASFFALNAGEGIVYDRAVIRPQGAYYVTNAFIFPGGTASKTQSSFLVNKDGVPLDFTNGTIGMAFLIETMLQTFNPIDLPPAGTLLESSNWMFRFNDECDDSLNSISALGSGVIQTITVDTGIPAFEFDLGVATGFGCNANPHHNTFTAKIYVASDQTILIKVKFHKEIEYKD